MHRRTKVWENNLIWLGAGISIAEILTGTYFAPLGFVRGVLAILIGHLIGCTLLFFAGLIGSQTRQNAMNTVKGGFGHRGSIVFALLNACQLIGWTGIMIYDAAVAAHEAFHLSQWLWCVLIGLLIIVWLWIGIEHLGKLNTVALTLLLLLTIWLSFSIFHRPMTQASVSGNLSFGAAVELGVSMPLSWLPLISDYTSKAKRPVVATLGSVISYGLVSCWMYLIGLGMSLFAGQTNIAKVMVASGMGVAGLLIIVFSTVTTTFMDAYSAGVSLQSIWPRLNGTRMAMLTTVVGTIGAIVLPMDNITNFLYLIGSVFAPMITVLMADYFIFHHDSLRQVVNYPNFIIWVLGFIAYRFLMQKDTIVGNTLPDVIIVLLLCCLWEGIRKMRHSQLKTNN